MSPAIQRCSYQAVLQDEAKGAGWFSEALDRLVGRESGIKSKYVIVDGLQEGNDAFQDGDITYVSRNIFTDTEENGEIITKNEKMARAFAHETDHFAEGSKEYITLHALMKQLGVTDMAIADMRSKAVGDGAQTVADAYGIGSDVIDAIEAGKDTSGLNQAQVRLALSEIRAKETEIMFGNREMIDKLVAEDKNIAKKILHRVQNAIKEIKAFCKGDTKELNSLKMLKAAEKMFSDSLAEAGQGYLRKKAQGNVDAQPEVQHSKRGTVVITLDEDSELAQRIRQSENAHEAISKYIKEKFGGRTFVMSDGVSTIIDNTDASKLASRTGGNKSAEIENLERIIEKAVFARESQDVQHPKFKSFRYYDVEIACGAENYELELHVGLGKYDGKHHLYDIQRRNTAHQSLDAAGSEDNRLHNGVPNISISENEEKSTSKSKIVFGYTLDADANVNEELLEELSLHDKNAKVDRRGNITVYHRTTSENATKIKNSGIMTAEEDALFFSSQSSGYANDYGDTAVEFCIPSTKLRVNDIFDGEVHFDMPLKFSNGGWKANVSQYIVRDTVQHSIRGQKILPPTAEQDIIREFGTTYRWNETLYLTQDGRQIDGSGRNQGGHGGYRAVDHRDIASIFDTNGTDAMIEFMARGNIRVIPESPGVNITIEPTKDQYRLIQQFVERVGWENEGFTVDFDDVNGNTIDSISYEGRMSARKVVADIQYFFQEGKVPQQSELSRFRYSRRGSIKHEDLLKLFNGMQLDFFGRAFAKIDAPSKFFEGDERNARLASQIEQMSTLGISEQTKYADDLATAIIQNMMMTDVSPEELDVLMHDASIVNRYRHKLNIKPLMAEIESKYGKNVAQGIALQWQSPSNKTGVGVDTIVEELRADGILIKSNNEADIFFEMMDSLEKARKKTEKVLNKHVGEVLSEEEQTALHDEIRDDILDFMQEHGADADWAANYKRSQRQMKKMLDDARARATAIIDQATLQAQQIEERAAQEGRDYKKLLALEQQQFEAGMHDDLEFYKAQKEAELRDEVQAAQSEAADSIDYMVKVQRATDDAYNAAVSVSKMERKKYHNATKIWNDPIETLISQLSGIKYRGVLRKYGTRKILTEFGDKWYNLDNEVLNGGLTHEEAEKMYNDNNVTHVGYLDKHVLRAIEYMRSNLKRPIKVGKNKGELTNNNYDLTYYELRAAECVISGAKRIVETYDKVAVSFDDSVSLSESAKVDTERAEAISGHVNKKFKLLRSTQSLIRQIITPDAILAEMFGHSDAALMPKLYRFLLDGVTQGQRAQIEMDNIIENFLRTHKGYERHFNNDEITVAGHKMPVSVAIDLIMTSRDSQSWDNLIKRGWGYKDSEKQWHPIGTFTLEEIEGMTKGLEQRDIDCLEMLRKFYDTTTDYTIKGQKRADGTSMLERDKNARYYPRSVYSGDIATIVEDKVTMMSILTPGFLKERLKHGHRLSGMDAFQRARMHSKAVGQYYGSAVPMRELQRLYNCNVSEDANTRSIRTIISEKSDATFDAWFASLLEDIQGVRKQKDTVGSKIVEGVRSNTMKAILSLNIKSMMSQLSGYPAAFAYLDAASMGKAFTKVNIRQSFNTMMKYCDWAFVKHYSGGAVLAQTLTEKFNKATEIGTIGVQGMDTLLNVMIWNACQMQVESNHKGDATFKFGTEANMKEAAVLHTTVGIKTQGNSAKGEQSAMQRSPSQIVKAFAVWNSDGFKMISRLYEGIDRLLANRYLEQHGEKVSASEKKDATKFAAKATTALLVSNLVYVLIGELFKHMLNKDPEEDKDGNEQAWLASFGINYLTNLIGNVPILRDVCDYLVDGYDVKDYSIGAFNDILKGMGDGIGIITTLASGEAYETKDIAAPLKSMILSIGTIAGLPTSNLYNYLYGFTKRFDESAAYDWNSFFYTNNYAADLTKAVEKGDTDLQTTIVGLMLKDDGMTDTSAKVNEKLRELYAEGLTVLPRSVNETFSFDGEVYTMTQRQRKAFKAVYAQANDEVEALINNKGLNTLPKEVQAKAIRWIYDYYYESAVYKTVGEEPDSKKQLFGETMDISKFAMTIAACATTESELDKKGNVIAGSKKKAVLNLLNQLSLTSSERLIVLAYLGYSVEEDAKRVKSYILRIGLSKAQQKVMLDYCGISA